MNKETSKYISYLLRHNPEELIMDINGYVYINDLLNKLNISFNELDSIVQENNKQRFSYNYTNEKIRANQGHTIKGLELNFKEVTDENLCLYHGTSIENYEKIKLFGLSPMLRNYVHLTDNIETAKQTGLRHCKNKSELIILYIYSKDLIKNNIKLEISDNNVYQVESIIPINLINI